MATHLFGDTAVLTGRTMRHVTRSPDTIITTAIMPIAIMLLFVYVFGGAIDTGTVAYVNYMLPGILLITIASGISYTAFRLFTDMQGGIFERFQSMPVARSGVLWAHVLTSLAANVVSLVVVVGAAILMGFRSGAGVPAWLAVVGILILFTLALTWIAVIPGLTAKSVDGASAFAYPLIFLPFISSAFVPTGTMPGPVRAFAEHQPVTSIVNAIRDLFTDQPVGTGIWIALAYAQHLLDLYDSGRIADAAVFPSVLGAQAGDPRDRYSDTALRRWFVVFDGDAGTWVTDGGTQWYDTNHYLAVVTDAYDVAPALSATAPTLADAQARVAELAADGASFVSTDWNSASADAVLSDVLPRG